MHGFREFVGSYPPEAAILGRLPAMPIAQQIQTDIALHRRAVAAGTFGTAGDQLAADSAWKGRLLKIVRGGSTTPAEVRNLIAVIERDMNSHRGRVPHPDTGSDAWHEAWDRVYRTWLDYLHHLGDSHGPQEGPPAAAG